MDAETAATLIAALGHLLQSGLGNLAAYLAAHVLLCLVPAFFIAGALAALIPKEAVIRYLGRGTPKYVSYPAATVAASLLAVCSCTIVPLFAGIYRRGAGLGPAVTFLFFAPAANILAVAYTGVAIGIDLAVARILLAITFGIGIGMLMAAIFRRAEAERDVADTAFAAEGRVPASVWVFVLLLVALLIAGTLQVAWLTRTYATVTIPLGGLDRLQEALARLVPFDASRGEEGVTAQGALLIVLLLVIGVTAWRGLENIADGFTRWTAAALALLVLTLALAAVRLVPGASAVEVQIPGKLVGVGAALVGLVYVAPRLGGEAVRSWLWESWRFVKQILPLLVAGVFVVGAVRPLINPAWVQMLAGRNGALGNAIGVLFGVFMYFPTLVEVPIARLFLEMGMHRGPLLAYLLADPELSLQSILIVSVVIGRRKAWVYVGWVALFSATAGLLYGMWVDGASVALIGGALLLFLALLATGLSALEHWRDAGERGLRGPVPGGAA